MNLKINISILCFISVVARIAESGYDGVKDFNGVDEMNEANRQDDKRLLKETADVDTKVEKTPKLPKISRDIRENSGKLGEYCWIAGIKSTCKTCRTEGMSCDGLAVNHGRKEGCCYGYDCACDCKPTCVPWGKHLDKAQFGRGGKEQKIQNVQKINRNTRGNSGKLGKFCRIEGIPSTCKTCRTEGMACKGSALNHGREEGCCYGLNCRCMQDCTNGNTCVPKGKWRSN